MPQDNDELISLNKYISSTGFCSRREADKLIEQARVSVNGKLVIEGVKVSAHDTVEIDGEPIKTKKKALYIAFNKPTGVTSTTDPKDKTNIIYFINHPKRIFPVGRLDKDSDGLIFLTNDGDIVNKILRASNNHEKEYVVSVDKPIAPDFIQKMSTGVPILGTFTKKCYVKQEGNKRFRIILTQGLNRQIRRMCEYLGYKVMKLTRVRIMNVSLENLPLGKWRYLSPVEVEALNKLVSGSSKTEEASYNKKMAEPTRTSKVISKKDKPAEKVPYKKDAKRSSKKDKPAAKKEFKKTAEKPSGKKQDKPKGNSKTSTWKDFRKKSR